MRTACQVGRCHSLAFEEDESLVVAVVAVAAEFASIAAPESNKENAFSNESQFRMKIKTFEVNRQLWLIKICGTSVRLETPG